MPFKYEVAGRSYVSERTGFDPPEFASCDVFRTRPYPAVGDTIRVIYDPGRPGEAVYLPAFPREAITSGLPFLAFTALFVAVTRRSLFTRS